jgi:hypothetical protein
MASRLAAGLVVLGGANPPWTHPRPTSRRRARRRRSAQRVKYSIALYLQHRLASGHDITLNIGNESVGLDQPAGYPRPFVVRTENVISVMRARDIARQ